MVQCFHSMMVEVEMDVEVDLISRHRLHLEVSAMVVSLLKLNEIKIKKVEKCNFECVWKWAHQSEKYISQKE